MRRRRNFNRAVYYNRRGCRGDGCCFGVNKINSRSNSGRIFEGRKFQSETKNIKLVTKNYKLKTDLEYPHYTRPEVFKWRGKKYPVPKILLSGNHAEIEKWRNAKRGGVKMRKARRGYICTSRP